MQSETLRKGQVFEVPATVVTFLAIAADTGGSFSLFEYRVAPQQGIPLHRHRDDEAFFVLEGTIEFQIKEQHVHLGPGEFPLSPNRYPIGITTGVLRKKDGCWRSRFQQAIMRGSLLRLGN